MNKTLKRIITNPRVLILLTFVLLSIWAINPKLDTGVTIQSVDADSPATQATPSQIPSQDQPILQSINGQTLADTDQYYQALQQLSPGETVSLKINDQTYFVDLPENKTDPGITVRDEPSTNIQQGLDLAGGTRVILEPVREVNSTERTIILNNIEQRVNAFGLSDARVTGASDLSGAQFFIVEVPGVSREDVTSLLRQQGNFEAQIGNETAFTGDDIQYVCRSAQCSGLVRNGCAPSAENTYSCQHRFSITISEQAAQNQASITSDLQVRGGSLSENITFFIDGTQVQSLTISSSLQGQETRELSISGTGNGPTIQEARQDSLNEMRQTQAILETGSLPVELRIVKTDTISPALGAEFLSSALQAGLLAILVVVGIVILRYREWRISIPMALTMLSEVTILLGAASLIGWNIDMAAVAAIIIAVGSGVDDQIVITDETIGRNKNEDRDWAAKLKKAFFIIMAAYFTLVVAMLPLLVAGAGLLKGFAITTIIGVTAGVLISRPAYAAVVEIILGEEQTEEA
jgi:preprotein translocase subunit SecD